MDVGTFRSFLFTILVPVHSGEHLQCPYSDHPHPLQVSQTYTSVHDNAQEVRNPLGITPTSLGKRREWPVWSRPPRTMHVKGLDNHLPYQEVRP
jgi:hypothetical protein